MKVYVLYYNWYEGRVLGVYSTYERAEAEREHVHKHSGKPKLCLDIYKFDLDDKEA